ncbi:MAG: hypothetical protein CW691_00890, partial [Candidatus Bathyarchaeum sp.]
TQFAVLPSSSQAFGTDLGKLAQSTLETLDAQGVLSETVFSDDADAWGDLQKALSASLPVNVVYNLSVYNISTTNGVVSYHLSDSISDSSFGVDSDSGSLLVASPDVTFTQDPEKVGGESTEITLYILNCSDANGWWVTGYTGQSLAADFYDFLSPYFTNTVLINTTAQFELLLEDSLGEGNVQNAVVVNPFGETVPIPHSYTQYGTQSGEGYYVTRDSHSMFCYTLGSLTRQYNWTWVSIVGYPLYYVSNTASFSNSDNGYGIYGMDQVGYSGLNAFLRGLDGEDYDAWEYVYLNGYWQWIYDRGSIATEVGVVHFTDTALDLCNYYGLYPSPYQTATRALPQDIEDDYHLTLSAPIFEIKNGYNAGATYAHQDGSGALTAIGLTRIPDIRVAALGLLMYYNPAVYRSEFGASGTSSLVTLQLGQQGGT